MKKILSIALAICMVFSLSTVAFADGGHSTKVKYVGTGDSEWKLEVPIQLAPGESGNVILSGTWDSVTTVNVTADETVTLSNDVDDTSKTLGITFESISQEGNMDDEITVTKPISVANMSGGLFGVWEGIFNYYVTVESVKPVEPTEPELIEFTVNNESEDITYTFYAEKGMTWRDWIDSEYNTEWFYIDNIPDDVTGEYIRIGLGTMIYSGGYVCADEIITMGEYGSFNYQEDELP